MTSQLLLLEGGRPVRHLDTRTLKTGRKGIAEARRRLAAVQLSEPVKPIKLGQLSRAS